MQTNGEILQDFYDACKTGDLEKVNYCLNLEWFDPALWGNWGLKFSVMHQHLEIVNRLLAFPGVVAKAADDNNHVLRNVLESGNLAILDRLLELPILVEQVKINGSKLVLSAIDGENLESVKRLLVVNPDLEKEEFLLSKKDAFIIEKVRNEIQTDRKNMLMLFKANKMQNGSIGQFSPEVLFKIASYIPSLRLYGRDQKAFYKHLDKGWKIAQLSVLMRKLSLGEPRLSHKRKTRRNSI